ncbi:lytic transglycosylase domain-containing protein [Rhizobium leguminosarum]|uniref:Lytic transglycosylase domain-containing protein n=1 Tax=Rhizobium laguerreae TaxID=1076926 RepID=A0A7Y2R5Q9_9HYPH|nr:MULTISPECIES: lytic transglycosylase domain-containing protein [Rhizobium]MBY5352469.1 lytic transglycosylase domain-containing protein [Rhizobium leguminosarum]NNH40366.1 lytic transglycosylase domain-containing protein [Rhizobium laguerreae]NNH64860.1 lytic transglycosylase domain-containing protein [Rhizobium laguerreae]UWM73936.1 lytic transglycosylase domain-containing protein [Rhizobium leguminosarum bv. viciae]UWU26660.1 lytic transglycosylase domain-containing protein [Rhizobium leg
MVAIGLCGLKRSLVVSTILCGMITGCASVEYTSQAELTAVQTVVPMPKPGEDATLAAIPTAEGAAVADATIPQASSSSLTATAMPAVTASQPGDLTMQPAAYAQIPLTPEMTAIQSVVPTPRPGTPAQPTTQLAFAATPQNSALAALAAVDTTPRASMDYGFDESGPIDPPTAPPMFSDDDKDDAPTVEKSFVTKLIAKYSKLYEIPETLLHRIVHRESRYNPKAYNKRGYFGLMQIKYNTAKSMGYDGAPGGLFDAETNIKYAAKYLRGAWLVSDNKEDDAVRLYARGYYYDAKRKGMTDIAQGNY